MLPCPGLKNGHVFGQAVEATQIASTILNLLGLNPVQFQAVRIEHPVALPGTERGAA